MTRLDRLTPALLTAPSALVYAGALLVPLAGVLVLSLHGFDFETGVLPGWGLANYQDLFTDPLQVGRLGTRHGESCGGSFFREGLGFELGDLGSDAFKSLGT